MLFVFVRPDFYLFKTAGFAHISGFRTARVPAPGAGPEGDWELIEARAQLTEEAFAQAHVISADEAIQDLKDNPDTLLVDVRDVEEVQATGLGVGAVNAPGRSIAWKACTEIDEGYREPKLIDRSRRVIATCGWSPSYRGASAANLLTEMGFTNVSYVEGGMAALLAAGFAIEQIPQT